MNTLLVPNLLEALAAELERPREMTAQVVNHVIGTYGIDRGAIGSFLVAELPKLEDYEIDLILSPLFTPTLQDQSIFAELLGRDSVPQAEWPGLIQQLVARPTRAQLVTEDEQAHFVPLREVTLERYVHRLRLDATIPDLLFRLLNHLPPPADRPLLKAIARRAIWESEARRQILVRYLTTTAVVATPSVYGGAERGIKFETKASPSPGLSPAEGAAGEMSRTHSSVESAKDDAYRLSDAVELLKLAETYEPANVADLLAKIPHWQQVLRQEINEAVSPKPFFNERVQEMHGGGRDQRRLDNPRVAAKENERAFLDRLQLVLAD